MSRLSPTRQKSVLELYGKQLEKFTSDQYPNVIDVVNRLLLADPTAKGVYLTWIVKLLVNGKLKIGEDEGTVKEDLRSFEKYKNSLQNKDINFYDLYSMRKALDLLLLVPEELPTTGNIVYDGPLGTLIYPMTQEEAIECGKGTRWCTAALLENRFDYYFKEGPLIVWIEKGGKYKGKYQFHFETAQFMDSSDEPIKSEVMDHLRKNPILKKVFQEGEKRLIAIGNIESMLDYAENIIHDRWREAETYIMKSQYAVAYARDIIHGRWREAEPYIMKSPRRAFHYAMFVIHGRWREAEPYILADPVESIHYIEEMKARGIW